MAAISIAAKGAAQKRMRQEARSRRQDKQKTVAGDNIKFLNLLILLPVSCFLLRTYMRIIK